MHCSSQQNSTTSLGQAFFWMDRSFFQTNPIHRLQGLKNLIQIVCLSGASSNHIPSIPRTKRTAESPVNDCLGNVPVLTLRELLNDKNQVLLCASACRR